MPQQKQLQNSLRRIKYHKPLFKGAYVDELFTHINRNFGDFKISNKIDRRDYHVTSVSSEKMQLGLFIQL